jgi:hypothetical protein
MGFLNDRHIVEHIDAFANHCGKIPSKLVYKMMGSIFSRYKSLGTGSFLVIP